MADDRWAGWDWASNGSCQDLSNSIFPKGPVSALVPTSQEGGNMQASNEEAMTAPGSVPVDVMHAAGDYFGNDPTITPTDTTKIEPSDDGKPLATGQANRPEYPPPTWKYRAIPDVMRKTEK